MRRRRQLPVRAERYRRDVRGLVELLSSKAPACLLVFSVRLLLKSYYGSNWAALRALFWEAVKSSAKGLMWRARFKVKTR